MTRKGLKSALDKICAKIVKERDNYTCQRCGSKCYGYGAHWSHIYGKRNLYMRWNLLNAILLCAGCHFWWHSSPDSKSWFANKFPARWEYLHQQWPNQRGVFQERCYITWKYTDDDLKNILYARKEKFEELQ